MFQTTGYSPPLCVQPVSNHRPRPEHYAITPIPSYPQRVQNEKTDEDDEDGTYQAGSRTLKDCEGNDVWKITWDNTGRVVSSGDTEALAGCGGGGGSA